MATKKILVLLLAVILTACNLPTVSWDGGASATPVMPTPTLAFIVPTGTPTSMRPIMPTAGAPSPTIAAPAIPTRTPSPTPTPTPTFTPTPTATATTPATPSLTPTLVSDWCLWRWSASCPATWAEIVAMWPEIQATYGINFELPVTEPTPRSVSGLWWLTLKPPAGPQLRLANVWPSRSAWPLGTFYVPKLGLAEFVIFTDCGNLGWRFVSPTQQYVQPSPTLTPVGPGPQPTSTPVPPPTPIPTATPTPQPTPTPTTVPTTVPTPTPTPCPWPCTTITPTPPPP